MSSLSRVISPGQRIDRPGPGDGWRAANACDVTAGLGAAAKRHPRKVAQSVVIVGPPRRCTMLREVVAIGRSRFLTEAYAAETEGIPTALSPTPRRNRAHASTATLNP